LLLNIRERRRPGISGGELLGRLGPLVSYSALEKDKKESE
jgi:hypothetical protein